MIVTAWIGVAEHDALHRYAARCAEVEHLVAVAEPGGHVHLHWEMRFTLRDACAGEGLALTRGELTADTDLTNDSRLDLGAARTFGDIADQFVGNVMLTLGVILFRL